VAPSAPAFLLLTAALAGSLALPAAAQPPGAPGAPEGDGPPPRPVGYTEARRLAVRGAVRLTGSVEARSAGVVASEVAGLVVELAAREGDRVGRGRPLVRLRSEKLELQRTARQADLKEAEARLELATRNQTRARELFASEVISRQQLDDAVSEFTAWQGRVESLEAEIARVEDDLERSVVRAPYGGVVVAERTQVGEWLDVGAPAMELAGLDDLEVVLEVPERYFADLRLGTAARIGFESLPGTEIEGKISAVVPRADPRARTFPVKVRFQNRDRRVGVGMLARVDFPVGAAAPATVVPKDAVVRQGDAALVWRIGEGGGVEPVPVTPGTAVGDWLAVDGALEPGQRVITRGNERIFPGMRVVGEPVAYPVP
jgi:RND family efflux transporter MFP subunit